MFDKARPLSKPTNNKEYILKHMCRFDLTIADVCRHLNITNSTFIKWMTDDVQENFKPEMMDECYAESHKCNEQVSHIDTPRRASS